MTWPRDTYVAAVWESQTLKPLERLVALAYADHARDGETAWVTYPRLMERTGLSRDALARALNGLREQGWLEVQEAARQQRATRYWLRIPEGDEPSASRTAGYPQESVSRTAEVPSGLADGPLSGSSSPSPGASSPSPVTSSPPDGPDYSSHHSSHQTSDEEESHRDAVAALLDRFPGQLAEEHAAAAVAAVVRKKSPDRPAAYMASFGLGDVHRWAGIAQPARTTTTSPPDPVAACRHGRRGGMRINGTGANASRLCDQCETESPAEIAQQLQHGTLAEVAS